MLCLLLLLLLHAAAAVDNEDVLLLGSLFNCTPCLSANRVSDNCGVNCVLSEKRLEVLDVVDNVRLESVWKHVLRLFIGSETAGWVDRRATLLTTETGIDTAAAPPRRLHTDKTVGLNPIELLGLLLDDVLVRCRGNACHVERPVPTAPTGSIEHVSKSPVIN